MIGASSADIALTKQEKARIHAKRSLSDKTDPELLEIFEKGRDSPIERTHEMALAPVDHPHFLGLGAYDLLEERKGKSYALGLIGLREPSGFKEKLRNYITGWFPKADRVAS